MLRRAFLLALLATVVPGARAQTPDFPRPRRQILDSYEQIRPRQNAMKKALEKPIRFPGITDTKATLLDALSTLRGNDLLFDINEAAFRIEGIEDPLGARIAEKPIGPMERTTPGAVLTRILTRIPVESGAVYIIRRNLVEITTRKVILAEYEPYLEEKAQMIQEQVRTGRLPVLDTVDLLCAAVEWVDLLLPRDAGAEK